jgi:hypothetical protein
MARIVIGFERFVKKKSVAFRVATLPDFLATIPLGGCVNTGEQITIFQSRKWLLRRRILCDPGAQRLRFRKDFLRLDHGRRMRFPIQQNF